MHRLKQRFLSAVEKKETSLKLKYEEIDMLRTINRQEVGLANMRLENVILEEIVDDEPPRTPSPEFSQQLLTSGHISVDEGDLRLSLTMYKSATPESSRSRGWKPTKRDSSCLKQLSLCWKDEATMVQ
ncbi:hypothetical protein L2E82_25152 [Cichorium intybus]|uniref:Uncharacterized protein n=1 Tax=Cichorium intybus TaxID=13427 RepID=A0ACB9E2T2_CICIN|nr:hypothetical protein L2E82_25152 [Cichorium intybus]